MKSRGKFFITSIVFASAFFFGSAFGQIVDDQTKGTGLNQFQYNTAWTYWPNTSSYNGGFSTSKATGDNTIIRFTGTQIRLYGKKSNSRGIAGCSIDGGTEATADEYSATEQFNTLVYTSPVLAAGNHTLKIRATGSKNTSSSGTTISVDRVEIFTTVSIDDQTKGTGLNQFQYNTAWTYWPNTSSYNGGFSTNKATGDNTLIRFSGIQIKLYGKKSNSRGIAGCSIDGGTETTADEYSAAEQYNTIVYTSPLLTAGTHTLKIRATGNKNPSSSGTTISVDRVDIVASAIAPTITTQPVSQTVNVGQPVSFSVDASGTTPFSYQWKLGSSNVVGATAATYTISSPQTSNAGSYTCVVTNSAGSKTSNVATLTIVKPPTFLNQPLSLTVKVGRGALFGVIATGTAPLSYQWKFNGIAIANANSTTYSITKVRESDGGSYTCLVTNSAGAQTSNIATLTVDSQPRLIDILAGEPELIYDGSDPIADANPAILKKDANNIYMWRSSWNQIIKSFGPLNNPSLTKVTASTVQTKDIMKIKSTDSALVQVSCLINGGLPKVTVPPSYQVANFYLTNIYNIGKDTLLGFLHLEYLDWIKNGPGTVGSLNWNSVADANTYTPQYYAGGFYNPTWGTAHHYRVGLCYSVNNGDTWTFCGDIIGVKDPAIDIRCLIHNPAFLVVGDYFYVYFEEKDPSWNFHYDYPAVARAKISDVVAAALQGRTTTWHKYNSNSSAGLWGEDGISGVASPLFGVSETGTLIFNMETDAAYCSPLKEYLILASELSPNFQHIRLYRSKDAINWIWADSAYIDNLTSQEIANQWIVSYGSFASTNNDASFDCSTVGKQFSIYYIKQRQPPVNSTDQKVYRVQFRIRDNSIIRSIISNQN